MFNHHWIWAYSIDQNAKRVQLYLEEKLNMRVKCLEVKSDLYHLFLLNGEVDYRKLANISSDCCCHIVYEKIGMFDDNGYHYSVLHGKLIDECKLDSISVALFKGKYNLDSYINF